MLSSINVSVSDRRVYGNISVLMIVQFLSLSTQVAFLPTMVLAGLDLSESAQWSNLPFALLYLGAMVGTVLTSYIMHRLGWRYGFIIGQAIAFLGAIGMILAVFYGSFGFFCVFSFMFGINNAFWLQLRFAVTDVVEKKYHARAIGLILLAGVASAFAGSQISGYGYDLLPVFYTGTFLLAAFSALISIASLKFLDIPQKTAIGSSSEGRALKEIILNFGFAIAFFTAMISYGVMNLVMSATPIVIRFEGFDFDAVRNVIQWHVFAMFAPSLITGFLIEKFGAKGIILTGALFNMVCFAVALSGVYLLHFHLSLIFLGLGWNFMFVGATAFLARQYRSEEASKVRSFNDFFIFVAVALSSLSSGILVNFIGWTGLILFALSLIVFVITLLLFDMAKQIFPQRLIKEQ